MMTEADQNEFFRMLEAVTELYDRTLSVEAQMLYWDVLKVLDLAEIAAALNRHVADPKRGRFMPLPADIMADPEIEDKRSLAEFMARTEHLVNGGWG